MAVYDDHQPRYATSQRKAQAARDFLAGKIKAPLDASILPGSADREALRASNTQKYFMPIKVNAMLVKDDIRLTRYPVGVGPRAMAAATKVEQVDNAVAELIYPHLVVTDLLLQEGAAFNITQPAMSFWGRTPKMFTNEDEEIIDKRYSVDKHGRGEDDPYYAEGKRKYREDRSKSGEYFKSVEMDYRARNLPIEMRALSIRECVPINPVRKGNRMVLDGMVRKSEWTVSNLLKAGYRWGEDGHMEPAASGATKSATMYELWFINPNGHVYTSYSIDGKTTTKGEQAAVIDLTETYGIESLPIAFDYGMSFPGADSDDRPIPFVDIFAKSWLNIDSAVTSLLVRFYKVANLYMTYEPNVDLLKHLGITDHVPMPEMKPGFMIPVLGKLQDANSSAGMREFGELISVLKMTLDEEMPSPDATGSGPGGTAGYAQNVAAAKALGTFVQVRHGQLSMKEQALGHFNEQAACIGREHRPLCVVVNQEIPVDQRKAGQQSSTRAVIEVDPDMFGDTWNVTAEIPQNIEDNMPLAQVLAEHHSQGKIPLRFYLEKGLGITDPDVFEAELRAEQAMSTPYGLAMLNLEAAQYAGDEEQAAIMEGIAAQELLKILPQGPETSDNVMPAASLAGMQGPAMTGMVAPNPVDSAVGGVMAGAMQSGGMAQSAGVPGNGLP